LNEHIFDQPRVLHSDLERRIEPGQPQLVVFEVRYEAVLLEELKAHPPQLDVAVHCSNGLAWVEYRVANYSTRPLYVEWRSVADRQFPVNVQRHVEYREQNLCVNLLKDRGQPVDTHSSSSFVAAF
jgi:hypothetical protein